MASGGAGRGLCNTIFRGLWMGFSVDQYTGATSENQIYYPSTAHSSQLGYYGALLGVPPVHAVVCCPQAPIGGRRPA